MAVVRTKGNKIFKDLGSSDCYYTLHLFTLSVFIKLCVKHYAKCLDFNTKQSTVIGPKEARSNKGDCHINTILIQNMYRLFLILCSYILLIMLLELSHFFLSFIPLLLAYPLPPAFSPPLVHVHGAYI